MRYQSFPRIIANFIITADGKVSTRNETPSNFGSAIDRKRLQEIRARGDALMVGRKTAEIDHMTMGISRPELRKERQNAGKSAEPLRVLVSGRGHLNLQAKIFSLQRLPLLLFTGTDLSPQMQRALPAEVHLHTLTGEKKFLKKVLNILYDKYHVRTLICEGGPTLMRSLLEIDAITEMNLTISPLVFGGDKAPTLTGLMKNFLPRPINFRLNFMDVQEEECFLTYERKHNL